MKRTLATLVGSCSLSPGAAFAAGPLGGPFSGGGGGAFGSIAAIIVAILILCALTCVVPELIRDARSGKGEPLTIYLFWVVGIPAAVFYAGYFQLSFWPAVGAGFASSAALGILAATALARR
jgi:hypothetical protein